MPHRRLFMLPVLLVAGLLSLGGCEVTGPILPDSMIAKMNPDTWQDRKVEDDPIRLPAAGPVAVDVQQFRGDVVVLASETFKEISVTVTRRTELGTGRKEESIAALETIDYSVDVVPGDLGQLLQVRTWTTHPEPYFLSTKTVVRVPEIVNVTVATKEGSIEIDGMEGALDATTTDGNVRVVTRRHMKKPVRIVTRDGDIDYRVRGESTGLFKCESAGGEVDVRVRYGKWKIYAGTDQDTLVGRLNDGQNVIDLRTSSGDIRIAVVGDPNAYGRIIAAP